MSAPTRIRDALVLRTRTRVVLSAALVGLTPLAVAGHHPWSGPVLWTVRRSHGVHVSDLATMLLAVALLAAVWLVGRSRPVG